MKLHLAIRCRWPVVFSLLMLLTSCGNPTPGAPPTTTRLVAIVTPSPRATRSLPCSTPGSGTLTATPLLLHSPSALPTLSPGPTLTAIQRRAFVEEMLRTNGGCELPCWWGVMPGQSKWQTVKDRFTAYGGFAFELPHPERLFDYRVRVVFVEQDGIVQTIQVIGEVFRGATSDHFAQDWSRYSPDQVLGRYGRPSQVMLSLVPAFEVDSAPYYQLVVLYEEIGTAIRYIGPATYSEPAIQACLIFERVDAVYLWLQSPDQETPLVQQAMVPDEMPYFRSLEEATGISVETFYETFREPNRGGCLEGPPTGP